MAFYLQLETNVEDQLTNFEQLQRHAEGDLSVDALHDVYKHICTLHCTSKIEESSGYNAMLLRTKDFSKGTCSYEIGG